MKICYVTHDIRRNTGSGIFAKNLADAIKILRPSWQIDFLVTESDEIKIDGHFISINKKDIWRNFFKIRNLFREYDIIHALDSFPYGFVVVMATLGMNKRIFITGMGSGAIFIPGNFLRNVLLKFSYKKVENVFVASSYILKRIKEKMPYLNIVVVNLGLGQKFLNKKVENLDIKKPYILTVGYLKKRKGYEYSIKAFYNCLENNPELNYVIVGNPRDSIYKKEINSLVSDLGIKNKVFFYENLKSEEMNYVYSNAKLFLLMPQEVYNDVEGFGMVYLEAASYGLPIVGSIGSSASDAVLDKKNGFLVPSKDVNAITSALNKILNDKDLLERFSNESKRFASIMTWEKTAKEYLKYYERLDNSKI